VQPRVIALLKKIFFKRICIFLKTFLFNVLQEPTSRGASAASIPEGRAVAMFLLVTAGKQKEGNG
jgi:hypothetical protein